MSAIDRLSCPYCDADLNAHALSCRCCGRDLTPVLPLVRRIDELAEQVAELRERLDEQRAALPAAAMAEPLALPAPEPAAEPLAEEAGRHPKPLLIGFVTLIAVYWMVVLWLDLPLTVLRFVSMALPFAVGIAYLGNRRRLTWLDAGVAVLFALAAVAAMNALLGWIDSTPMLPQDPAGWRETFFYALSIGASMFAGMLLRVAKVALTARGLTSMPGLRDGVLAVNKNVPMDTLKAIELTVLMLGAALSAVTGIAAGLFGVLK